MSILNKIDYIFLDLDGPVLEGKYRHYECYKDIIKKYGGNIIDLEVYWEMKRNKINRTILLEKSNFQENYDIFVNEWMNCIEKEKYLNMDILKPKLIETLEKWKDITDKIILVTMRQNRQNLLKQLDNLNILSLIDEVIDCPPQRTDTKYKALKNKNFRKAIFIGDTEEDMNTAKLLNIKSIGIINGLRKKQFLEADYYYSEIKDINFNELEIK